MSVWTSLLLPRPCFQHAGEVGDSGVTQSYERHSYGINSCYSSPVDALDLHRAMGSAINPFDGRFPSKLGVRGVLSCLFHWGGYRLDWMEANTKKQQNGGGWGVERGSTLMAIVQRKHDRNMTQDDKRKIYHHNVSPGENSALLQVYKENN